MARIRRGIAARTSLAPATGVKSAQSSEALTNVIRTKFEQVNCAEAGRLELSRLRWLIRSLAGRLRRIVNQIWRRLPIDNRAKMETNLVRRLGPGAANISSLGEGPVRLGDEVLPRRENLARPLPLASHHNDPKTREAPAPANFWPPSCSQKLFDCGRRKRRIHHASAATLSPHSRVTLVHQPIVLPIVIVRSEREEAVETFQDAKSSSPWSK